MDQDLSKEFSEISPNSAQPNLDAYRQILKEIIASERVAAVNAGLVLATINSILSSTSRTSAKSSSILGLMLGKRMQSYTKAYCALTAALAVGVLLQFFEITRPPHLLGILVPMALLIALLINQKALEFRVSRGFFGNNASEAAEFIRFLQAHSDKSDFNDGDKMKRLYPEPEVASEDFKVAVYGGEATT